MNLKIKDPCTENWNQMTPDATGRFCAVCAKSVHDFTDKPKEALLAFLLCSSGSPCIRMLASQEAFTATEVQAAAQNIIRSGKPLSAAALALVMLFASGCQSEESKLPAKITDAATGIALAVPVTIDSPLHADTVMVPTILGRMVSPKADRKTTQPVPEPVVMGEAPILMGAPPEFPTSLVPVVPEAPKTDTPTVPGAK